MLGKRKRPQKSVATGWKVIKKPRANILSLGARNLGIRTGGFAGRPGSRGELKWIDTINSGAFSATGTVQLLNGLAPGTGSSQRIGRKIQMRSLTLRWSVGCGTAGATVFRGRARVTVVYDSQTNAAAPAVTDIFDSISANSLMNLNNRGRFKVVWKKTFNLDQSGGLGASGTDSFKRLNLPTIYNAGTAGTVADIQTGGLFMVLQVINSGGVAATNQPDYGYSARIRYSDD